MSFSPAFSSTRLLCHSDPPGGAAPPNGRQTEGGVESRLSLLLFGRPLAGGKDRLRNTERTPGRRDGGTCQSAAVFRGEQQRGGGGGGAHLTDYLHFKKHFQQVEQLFYLLEIQRCIRDDSPPMTPPPPVLTRVSH